jgi:hypothetical protein
MNYKVAYAHGEMNPKKRHTMEDVHRVVPVLPDFPLYSYFGVYDGENVGRNATSFPFTSNVNFFRSRRETNS